ncbi:TetR/AcrR family transcriptional regulator [Leifsonia poae]|uniref:TetR/AcrR family transcriptional regulator n=1 Tax=Leifsonia poae TaxID=110933 RepID=UPI003D6644ED
MTLTPKGRATRARIIEASALHLRASDAGEITLDEVLAVSRTSKGQLFHYFPGGKEEILLEIVRFEAERVLTDQQPYLDELTTWASWERWRHAVIERYKAQGSHCPLNALIGQVGSTPGADEVVRDLFARWEERLARGIRAMQDAGSARPDLSPEQTAAALVAAIQGGVQLLRSTGRTDHLEAGIDQLLDHLRPEPSGQNREES